MHQGLSGDSWVMDLRQPVPGIHMSSASTNGFRLTFAPRLSVKDLSLALQSAKETGVGGSMGEAALKRFMKTNDDPRTTVSPPFFSLPRHQIRTKSTES